MNSSEKNQSTIVSKKELIYSVPIGPPKKGQTSVYRKCSHKDGLFKVPAKYQGLGDLWKEKVTQFGDKLLLENYSYLQVNEMAHKMGSWISKKKHQTFYLYCKNSVFWTVADIATWLYGFVNVPLHDTLGAEGLEYVLQLTEGTLLFTTSRMVDNFLQFSKNESRHISDICFLDNVPQQTCLDLKARGYNIFTIQSILLDEENINVQPPIKSLLEEDFTIIFTSGTTGNPKGVVLTQHNALTQILAVLEQVGFCLDEVHMSFLPIAHVLERCVNWVIIGIGGQIRYARHPLPDLLLDYQEIRPTRAVLVPRLLNKIYPKMKALYEQTGSYEEVRKLFGGRIKRVGIGAAAIAPEILAFFKTAFSCPFSQGFGQTETSGASLRMEEEDDIGGHVGGPTSAVEIKLRDVPEMGYLSTDQPPRGELCIRGDNVFSRYYRDPQNTRLTLTQQGWNQTGDIATILPNGSVKIIDRKKSLFKLQQGQYISPEKVEAIYGRCPAVAECFVHGQSLQNYAVAIVHPNLQFLSTLAKKLGINTHDVNPTPEFCKNKIVNQKILELMNEEAKRAGLFGFQKVKKITLYPISFVSLSLLTNTMKIKRHIARQVFSSQIQQMYCKND